MQLADLIWTLVGFLLTLLVFSYLLGDNFLFRLASYLFVGTTAGYLAVTVIYYVLWPRLLEPITRGSLDQKILALVPLTLGVMLLARLSPRLARLGNIPMGYLVGLGAAVAIGGAILGTLITQTRATLDLFDFQTAAVDGQSPLMFLIVGAIVLIGTVTTLVYFHFGASRKPGSQGSRSLWIEFLAGIGQIFIAITLGSLFAGVYLSAITALVDRIDFIKNLILGFM
jgi:hypothetical protein